MMRLERAIIDGSAEHDCAESGYLATASPGTVRVFEVVRGATKEFEDRCRI